MEVLLEDGNARLIRARETEESLYTEETAYL